MELRADPEWIAMVAEYAEAWGLGVSSLVRLAVTQWMNDNPPPLPPKDRPATEPASKKKNGGK